MCARTAEPNHDASGLHILLHSAARLRSHLAQRVLECRRHHLVCLHGLLRRERLERGHGAGCRTRRPPIIRFGEREQRLRAGDRERNVRSLLRACGALCDAGQLTRVTFHAASAFIFTAGSCVRATRAGATLALTHASRPSLPAARFAKPIAMSEMASALPVTLGATRVSATSAVCTRHSRHTTTPRAPARGGRRGQCQATSGSWPCALDAICETYFRTCWRAPWPQRSQRRVRWRARAITQARAVPPPPRRRPRWREPARLQRQPP